MSADVVGEPYASGMLATGDGHHVYWEECGNPDGKPAVVLHGGPGSGASPSWRRYFDLSRYRVVLLDQRGCGRSRPHAGDDLAALEHNTTAHLVADLEALRTLRGIDRWLLLGASWGSTLALSYAVEHPDRVSEMVLWAVVTTRERDVHWLTHVMGEVYPEEFDRLLALLPPDERGGNVPAAVHRLLLSEDAAVRDEASLAWCAWEDRLAAVSGPPRPDPRFEDPRFRLGWTRLVTHYFGHHAFQADDAIVGRLDRLAHVPAVLLRGRLDIASPLRSAYEVASLMPRATLHVVEADAHGAGDDTRARIVAALDRFAG
ncbi:prolyl aminopeptidase [Nocardioides euryhalodurans]|uniref:Proline iminopeptidase n=1 Tax=Nocardioides euryhalodurans TaxID=2518370 RepID=A0A4P7GQE7_9ACTN|nr:prolyl aminopeptidase [Nocardioides euryhalodurans]QBR94057.1 prolyl aminopeptidase [Nocardioides euryhalodurans]